MSSPSSTDRIEQFFHHLAILKEYARRVIVTENPLTPDEEQDRAERIQEFLNIGYSFDLTEKEMVTILYREIFTVA